MEQPRTKPVGDRPVGKRRWPTPFQLTLGIVLAGLLWRTVRYALGFPIWGDEAFVAVNFVARDFRGMFEPLLWGQIAPLGFMWTGLAFSRVLGLSEWALRLLPYLAGAGGLLLFWRFARSVLPARAALPAVGIFAASYYLVRHGAEVKPYATDLLISLALTMLGWAVIQRPAAARRWAALIAAAGAAVWCSYPAVFTAGGVGLVLTWQLARARFRVRWVAGWVAFGLVLCGSFLAMYVTYARPHAGAAAALLETQMWKPTFPPLHDPWGLARWLVGIHTGLMFAYPLGGSRFGSVGTFILFVLGCVHVCRRRPALGLLLLAPFALAFVAAALQKYPYGGTVRTSIYLAPAICLLAGVGLFDVLRRWCRGPRLRAALTIGTLALAAITLGGIIDDLRAPYKSAAVYRSQAAVRAIAARARPADRWVVFNATEPVSYAPYLGDWRGVGGQFVFDVLRFAPVVVVWAPPPETVAFPSADQSAQAGEQPGDVWLLVYRAQGRKVTFPQEQWDAYLTAVSARLGRPRHESFPIKEEPPRKESEPPKVESLEVYLFPAAGSSSGGA